MKEYMFIFIGTDYEGENFSPQLVEQQMGKWFAWVDELKSEDLYIEGRPLLNDAKRVAGSDQIISDGPFVETKELVGGYFIIKAKDWDHAMELTKGYPDYDYGGFVEVREIAVYA
jgi:hypothetical protein